MGVAWARAGVFQDGSTPMRARAFPNPIAMRIGDDCTVNLTIQRTNGQAKNLLGSKVLATLYARDQFGPKQLVADSVQFASPSLAVGGKVTVTFSAGSFAKLITGAAQWDVWVTDSAGAQAECIPRTDVTIIPRGTQYPFLDGGLGTPPPSPITAQRGDILIYDGSSYQVLHVGTPGTVLTADPSATLGVSWLSPTIPDFLGFAMRRTISQPADGSDFVVTLPEAYIGNYAPQAQVESSLQVVEIQVPNGMGDRTATQFRVLTSAPLDDGDTLLFQILPIA